MTHRSASLFGGGVCDVATATAIFRLVGVTRRIQFTDLGLSIVRRFVLGITSATLLSSVPSPPTMF